MLQVGNVGLTVAEQRTHFNLWCIAGAPLLAGTDIVHASNLTLSILTQPEVIAVNQDLGLHDRIQGTFLGSPADVTPSATLATPANKAVVVVERCSSAAADEAWSLIDPTTGAVAAYADDVDLQIRQKSSGMLLTVTNCERAIIPHGQEPNPLSVAPAHNSSNPGQCDGKDQLFQFHKNGTITSGVDGQCFNVEYKLFAGHPLQTFDCAAMGSASNGQFEYQEADGQIKARDSSLCITTVSSPGPGPGPSPPQPPSGGSEVWSKPLNDGKRVAVLLLNGDGASAMDLTVSWAQLNLTSTAKPVRDLIARKDLGSFAASFTVRNVPPHGSALLSISV